MLNVICKIVKIYQKVNYFNLILKIFITLMKIKLTLIKIEKMILILRISTINPILDGGGRQKSPLPVFLLYYSPWFSPQNFLTFSFDPFTTMVLKLQSHNCQAVKPSC